MTTTTRYSRSAAEAYRDERNYERYELDEFGDTGETGASAARELPAEWISVALYLSGGDHARAVELIAENYAYMDEICGYATAAADVERQSVAPAGDAGGGGGRRERAGGGTNDGAGDRGKGGADAGGDGKRLLTRPRMGHDAGDHPPITPVKCACERELMGDQWVSLNSKRILICINFYTLFSFSASPSYSSSRRLTYFFNTIAALLARHSSLFGDGIAGRGVL